jgi:hypothetical protein
MSIRSTPVFIALFLVSSTGLLAQGTPALEVRKLQLVLAVPATDAAGREKALDQAIGNLTTLSQLAQALALREWHDQDPDTVVAGVDQAARVKLVRRYEQEARRRLQEKDAATRLAVLTTLAETGSIRGVDQRSLTSGFAPDLADFICHTDGQVRRAATRTMGMIRATADVAQSALGELLQAGGIADKLAVLDGVEAMAKCAAGDGLDANAANQVHLSRAEALADERAAAVLAIQALKESNTAVRRRAVAIVAQITGSLEKLAPVAPEEPAGDVLPIHRKDESPRQMSELLAALIERAPVLAEAMAEVDPRISSDARHALDGLIALDRRVASTHDSSSTGKWKPTAVALGAKVQATTVDTRRAAIDVLEMLGPSAEPAAPAIVRALGDPDRFVRWSAARTLGKIGPIQASSAVPALGKLLQDADSDLRLAAAGALEHYGPAARSAVPLLVHALEASDAEFQVRVLHTLASIGHPYADAALDAIQTALSDSDARVRQAAAEALGEFGSAAGAARPALLKALGDKVLEVQKAAGDALLKIK